LMSARLISRRDKPNFRIYLEKQPEGSFTARF